VDGLDLGALFDGGAVSAPQPIEGDGTISGGPVNGSSCPSLTFMVGPTGVRIDPSTQFVGGSCAALRLGTRIHGRGALNTDGSVSMTYLAVLN